MVVITRVGMDFLSPQTPADTTPARVQLCGVLFPETFPTRTLLDPVVTRVWSFAIGILNKIGMASNASFCESLVAPLRTSIILQCPSSSEYNTLESLASHVLNLLFTQSRLEYKDPNKFGVSTFIWIKNLCGGALRLFDGSFFTDGYGVRIVMRSPDDPKGAGRKRKSRDEKLFPNFSKYYQSARTQKYSDIVFIDPNLRDTLFMMHIHSSRNQRRILRYTSMVRSGTNIARDRRERFINHCNI